MAKTTVQVSDKLRKRINKYNDDIGGDLAGFLAVAADKMLREAGY